jgi:hypothetical protein
MDLIVVLGTEYEQAPFIVEGVVQRWPPPPPSGYSYEARHARQCATDLTNPNKICIESHQQHVVTAYDSTLASRVLRQVLEIKPSCMQNCI